MKQANLLATLFVGAAVASANAGSTPTFSYTITDANQAATSGDTLQFHGTISALGAGTWTILSALTSVDSPLVADDSWFVATYITPAVPLNNAVLSNVPLFSVYVPASTPTGNYTGTFSMFAGLNIIGTDGSNQVPFDIKVTHPTPPPTVPAPAALVSFGAGLFGAARRRRCQRAN